MADFDDLIPNSSARAPPALDNPFNPFENPFSDTPVRPRSPDPWAVGPSFYDQPEFTPDAERMPTEYDAPTPNALPVEPIKTPTIQAEPATVDPLASAAASSVDSDDVPLRRNPFRPLPVVKPEPKPEVSSSKPADDHAAAPDASRDSTSEAQTPIATPKVEVAPAAAESVPRTTKAPPPQPLAIPNPSDPLIADVSQSTATPSPSSTKPVHPPSTPASPIISSSGASSLKAPTTDTASTPPAIESESEGVPPPSASTSSLSSIQDTSSSHLDTQHTPRYDRVVSPLQTPSGSSIRTPLDASMSDNGFSNVILGGEAPRSAWAGARSESQSSFTSARRDSIDTSTVLGQSSASHSQSGHSDERVMNAESPSHSVATLKEGPASPVGFHVSYGAGQDGSNETNGTTPKRPIFTITVGDPQKVGDPISAHIVYTVTTQTTSSAFKKSTFSVLRRYSDFLWLYEAVVANNPGVIVPPVPDKKLSYTGRFEKDFVEGRRAALEKCIDKIANHPRLGGDVDLKCFLESDTFSMDIKHRKAEVGADRGLISTIGSSIVGSKFYETDEWFDKKRAYLEALESQLKGLVKTIEAVAKQRLEVIQATAEFAEAISALATSSDLSKQLSSSLGVLSDVERKAKELSEEQNRQDVVTVLGTVEEYIRLIQSVRLAFSSRVKTYNTMKTAENEKNRVKSMHEKTLRQRSLDRQTITPIQREIELAETRAQEAKNEYENVTGLVKAEFARFEAERVMDFKNTLETFLEGMIARQTEDIDAWEGYQQILLKRSNMNPNGSGNVGTPVVQTPPVSASLLAPSPFQ